MAEGLAQHYGRQFVVENRTGAGSNIGPEFVARSAADARTSAGWHWHLEILPRLSEFAGVELGTGCHITTVSAEDSAQRLRDAAL